MKMKEGREREQEEEKYVLYWRKSQTEAREKRGKNMERKKRKVEIGINKRLKDENE